MPNRFSEEWWEHIGLVNTIMLYKINSDIWENSDKDEQIKQIIIDTHNDVVRLERKIDLIMEKLGIAEEE